MLILTREQNERIMIGTDIIIEVLRVQQRGTKTFVSLGITAPAETTVLREELFKKMKSQNENLEEFTTVNYPGVKKTRG